MASSAAPSDAPVVEILGHRPPVFAYLVTVVTVGIPVVAAALLSLAASPPATNALLSALLFLILALIADLKPVPLDEGKNEVSAAFVFIVAAGVMFGWQSAVVIAATSVLLSELVNREAVARSVFNGATYAVAALSTGVPPLLFGPVGESVLRLTAYAFGGGALFVAANVLLVTGIASLAMRASFFGTFHINLRHGGAAFAIMAFLAALAANLWVLQPALLVLLAGPLFTLTLYQRSALTTRIATRDAHTDNLTGLGNHRAYQAALREWIERADEAGSPFALCLVDVDDFKHANDQFGHAAGDEVLCAIAELLSGPEGGVAFRFGGDEFALLLEADEASAYRTVDELQRQPAVSPHPLVGTTTLSIGIACYPFHAQEVEELQRVADGALYWSKRHGKNRSCLYTPSVVRIYSPAELEQETERQSRLRAATNIVRFVDAKDRSTAGHSQVVALLAEAIGRELLLEPELVEQLKLAGLLHDVGKIGVPDAILQAPRRLTFGEFEVIKQHPEIGRSLLDGLELDPIDTWIRHHHEHWDGSGYPDGLAGNEIPFGSQIIHVADAFEAMTTDRPYRKAMSTAEALEELRIRAGTQFDPAIVAALESHLAGVPTGVVAIA